MNTKRAWLRCMGLICLSLGMLTQNVRAEAGKPQPLFDGKTFDDWDGDIVNVWRIENGAFTAGSLEKTAPRNEFLSTKRVFENFDLRLRFKIDGLEKVNAGVQFRTARIPNHHEVSGYQADIGPQEDGHLYDESRRNRMLASPSEATLQKARNAIPRDGWQSYRIRAEGNRIQLWLNGVETVDYVERDNEIASAGVIALQIHGGMKAVVAYKDIEIVELNGASKSNDSRSSRLPSPASTYRKPNFIIVMVDDMGYAGLSCFGNPYFKTPELDRLAADGMRLTDFHSSGALCSPTRAGLLTGRYQQRAGIEGVIHPESNHPEHRKGLQLVETTYAETLKEAGYATGIIGKWHLGYTENSSDFHPQNHGFEEFVGYHSGNIDFVSHIGDHFKHDWWHGREETREEGYTTHLINEYALEFVRRHANSKQPFCLYVAHEAIHNPVQVPGNPAKRTTEHWDRWKWNEVGEEERIAKFRGMTLPVDDGVGKLRQALLDLGIAEHSLVLFFSDNGPSVDFPSGTPSLRGGKGDVYEGGHKVPAIAWWPGTIEPGSTSDETLISIDVMPTLLSLAQVDMPARKLDGRDFSPLLLEQAKLRARLLYWAALGNNGVRGEALRDGNWKIVVQHPRAMPGTFENERLELYNLESDPAEKHNLADLNKDRATHMLAQLKLWYADTQSVATPQIGGWLSRIRNSAQD